MLPISHADNCKWLFANERRSHDTVSEKKSNVTFLNGKGFLINLQMIFGGAYCFKRAVQVEFNWDWEKVVFFFE